MFNNHDWAKKYLEMGFQVVPTAWGTKSPLVPWKNWNKEFVISEMKRYKQFNIAILLGTIIDVEGDDANANAIIDEAVNGYAHPVYLSFKSKHHLFLNPFENLTRVSCDNIEFRANRHISVMPPSMHEKHVKYEWINNNSFVIPPLPDSLISLFNKLNSKTKKKKNRDSKKIFSVNHKSSVDAFEQLESKRYKWNYDCKPGNVKTICPVCNHIHFYKKRYHISEIKAFSSIGREWACGKCREYDISHLRKTINRQLKAIPN